MDRRNTPIRCRDSRYDAFFPLTLSRSAALAVVVEGPKVSSRKICIRRPSALVLFSSCCAHSVGLAKFVVGKYERMYCVAPTLLLCTHATSHQGSRWIETFQWWWWWCCCCDRFQQRSGADVHVCTNRLRHIYATISKGAIGLGTISFSVRLNQDLKCCNQPTKPTNQPKEIRFALIYA